MEEGEGKSKDEIAGKHLSRARSPAPFTPRLTAHTHRPIVQSNALAIKGQPFLSTFSYLLLLTLFSPFHDSSDCTIARFIPFVRLFCPIFPPARDTPPHALRTPYSPSKQRWFEFTRHYFHTDTTMGGSLSRLWSLIWTKKEIRILILGLVR